MSVGYPRYNVVAQKTDGSYFGDLNIHEKYATKDKTYMVVNPDTNELYN